MENFRFSMLRKWPSKTTDVRLQLTIIKQMFLLNTGDLNKSIQDKFFPFDCSKSFKAEACKRQKIREYKNTNKNRNEAQGGTDKETDESWDIFII